MQRRLVVMISMIVVLAILLGGCGNSKGKSVEGPLAEDTVVRYHSGDGAKLVIDKIDFSNASIGEQSAYIPIRLTSRFTSKVTGDMLVEILDRFAKKKEVHITSWSTSRETRFSMGICVTFEPIEEIKPVEEEKIESSEDETKNSYDWDSSSSGSSSDE